MLCRLSRRLVSLLLIIGLTWVLSVPAASAFAEPPRTSSIFPAGWIQQLWTELQEVLGFTESPVPGSGDSLCDGGPGLDPSGEPCGNDLGLDTTGAEDTGNEDEQGGPGFGLHG